MPEFIPGLLPPPHASLEARWLVFQGNRLLVNEGTEPARVPEALGLGALGLEPVRIHYLGALGRQPWYAAEVSADAAAPAGWVFESLRHLLARVDPELFALAARAFQIKEWDRCHQFCGVCGSPTVLKQGERARECPGCGELYYPRLSPVVMVLVRRGNELLLARSPRFPAGMYSALAGFVEPGETLEQAARREVREEVGVEITNLRYFGSQSWPFPHSLMIAFVADHAGGEIRLGDPEIESAGWYSVEQLPQLPHPLSIARGLIDAVLAEAGDGQ